MLDETDSRQESQEEYRLSNLKSKPNKSGGLGNKNTFYSLINRASNYLAISLDLTKEEKSSFNAMLKLLQKSKVDCR